MFCCYIDFQKAFDCVDRDLLLIKLLDMGIDDKFYWALKNSLTDTSACVRLNGYLTDYFSTLSGVRQGDVLSPNLFSIYINDLLVELRAHKKESEIILTNVLAYADDIVLIAEDEQELQRLINIVKDWCTKWKMHINISKTKIVHYRKIRRSRSVFHFKWGDHEIEITNGYRYLGIFLDEFLNFKTHTANIINAAGRALGKILSKFAYFKNVGYTTFTKLFENYVEPIIMYGISILGTKKFYFEKIQQRAIRYFLGLHPRCPIPALFGEMGWVPIRFKRLISMCRTWNRHIFMDENRINKQVFVNSLHRLQNNWCSEFRNICEDLNFVDSFENLSDINVNTFKMNVHEFAESQWRLNVESKPKLRNYKLYKTELSPEPYVTKNLNRYKRSIFAQLRCGILPLNVEIGRFRGVEFENRLCNLCNLNEVETETHFLLECPAFNRNPLYQSCNFNAHDNTNEDTINNLMLNNQLDLVNFTANIWNERTSKLYN